MNCTCVKDTERRLAAAPFVADKAGENVKATCEAAGITMTNDMQLRATINIPFRITGTAKGFTKGKLMPCIANYCPFCGLTTGRHVVGEDVGIAAAFGGAA